MIKKLKIKKAKGKFIGLRIDEKTYKTLKQRQKKSRLNISLQIRKLIDESVEIEKLTEKVM